MTSFYFNLGRERLCKYKFRTSRFSNFSFVTERKKKKFETEKNIFRKMAGSLTASTRRGNAEASSEIYRWMIGFARFVHYPSTLSQCPGLRPLGRREVYHSPHGTWLSASSSTLSLQMFDEVNRSDAILSVKLGEKVLVS